MSVLVQKEAPTFTAAAIMPDNAIDENFSLQKYRGRYVVLFFYPLDFTFVCPSEILAFDHRLDDFRKRECEVIGVSVDSHFTHLAWKNTPVDEGGIGAIKFPLVADLTKQIARDYGILSGDSVALRGTFLIDKEASCATRSSMISAWDETSMTSSAPWMRFSTPRHPETSALRTGRRARTRWSPPPSASRNTSRTLG
jgi:alkyl hydroperoxide reductase subunit AhpC